MDPSSVLIIHTCNVGALTIRIGFWRFLIIVIVYHTPKTSSNYSGSYIFLLIIIVYYTPKPLLIIQAPNRTHCRDGLFDPLGSLILRIGGAMLLGASDGGF